MFNQMLRALAECGWIEGKHYYVWYEFREIEICLGDDSTYFIFDENDNLIKITP